MPRADLGSPLLLFLPESADTTTAAELVDLVCDLVLAIDVGGEILAAAEWSRVRRSLRLLQHTNLPPLLAVVGPGSDGMLTFPQLGSAVSRLRRHGAYHGAQPLAPLLPDLERLSAGLTAYRTPRVILQAAQLSPTALLTVPRELYPAVPVRCLLHMQFFDGYTL